MHLYNYDQYKDIVDQSWQDMGTEIEQEGGGGEISRIIGDKLSGCDCTSARAGGMIRKSKLFRNIFL